MRRRFYSHANTGPLLRYALWPATAIVALGAACNSGAPHDAPRASTFGPAAHPALRQPEAQALDNGMKILVLEQHSAPVVSVQVWYRVGSRNEPPGKRGLAHLLEHLMFKGSPDVGPEDHMQLIETLGGRAGAFTSDDATAYTDTVPTARLELAMALEAERMTRARFDPLHFFKEREVVKEEIRLFHQNNPWGTLFEQFRQVAYTVHPYRYPVGGTLFDLDQITRDDVVAFYRTYYSPRNAVLVVVGDTTLKAVKSAAERSFGLLAAGPVPPGLDVVEPPQTEPRRRVVRHPTQMAAVTLGYKCPPASDADAPVLDVLATILGEGPSSRLQQSLVHGQRLAAFVGANTGVRADPGVFLLAAGLLPGKDPSAVEQAMLAQVIDLAQNGPTADELAKAKRQVSAAHIFGLDQIEYLGHAIGAAETVDGDYRTFMARAQAYEAIDSATIRRVAKALFVREHLTVVHLLPQESEAAQSDRQEATVVSQANRETPDWPRAPRFLNLPDPAAELPVLPRILRQRLDNGLSLVVAERHELPVLHFRLRVPGGKSALAPGEAGVAEVFASALAQGTTNENGESHSEQIDRLGGQVSAVANNDHIAVNAQFLAGDKKTAIALLADLVLRPSFADAAIDMARGREQAMSDALRDKPLELAEAHLDYLVFGYAHPNGRPTSGDTLAKATRERLRAFHRQSFGPNGAVLVVAGDLDADVAMAELAPAFAAWPRQDAPKPPTRPLPRHETILRLVDKPDLTQATVILGKLGVARGDPAWDALTLGNAVLGGNFSSRLMTNVRSKGGKTYRVRSQFTVDRNIGRFDIRTFTRSQEAAATLQLCKDELTAISQRGVTEKELVDAKNYLTGVYALRLQPTAGFADVLAEAEFYGLGPTAVRDYPAKLLRPSVAEVNAALRQALDPKDLAIVVVGRAQNLATDLARFATPRVVPYLEPIADEERSSPATPTTPGAR